MSETAPDSPLNQLRRVPAGLHLSDNELLMRQAERAAGSSLTRLYPFERNGDLFVALYRIDNPSAAKQLLLGDEPAAQAQMWQDLKAGHLPAGLHYARIGEAQFLIDLKSNLAECSDGRRICAGALLEEFDNLDLSRSFTQDLQRLSLQSRLWESLEGYSKVMECLHQSGNFSLVEVCATELEKVQKQNPESFQHLKDTPAQLLGYLACASLARNAFLQENAGNFLKSYMAQNKKVPNYKESLQNVITEHGEAITALKLLRYSYLLPRDNADCREFTNNRMAQFGKLIIRDAAVIAKANGEGQVDLPLPIGPQISDFYSGTFTTVVQNQSKLLLHALCNLGPPPWLQEDGGHTEYREIASTYSEQLPHSASSAPITALGRVLESGSVQAAVGKIMQLYADKGESFDRYVNCLSALSQIQRNALPYAADIIAQSEQYILNFAPYTQVGAIADTTPIALPVWQRFFEIARKVGIDPDDLECRIEDDHPGSMVQTLVKSALKYKKLQGGDLENLHGILHDFSKHRRELTYWVFEYTPSIVSKFFNDPARLAGLMTEDIPTFPAEVAQEFDGCLAQCFTDKRGPTSSWQPTHHKLLAALSMRDLHGRGLYPQSRAAAGLRSL